MNDIFYQSKIGQSPLNLNESYNIDSANKSQSNVIFIMNIFCEYHINQMFCLC